MAWGEAAAEQHEKDQPSTCLRPDGASPELEPLRDREDFAERMELIRHTQKMCRENSIYGVLGTPQSYHEERLRKADAEMDQLVLMRARQIVEEADERRRKVLEKVAKTDA